MIVLTSLLIASSFLYYLSLLGNFLPELTSQPGIVIFAILAASIYGTGQYILDRFVRQISRETSVTASRFSFSFFNLMFIATWVVFYLTALFTAIIVFQTLTSSQYSVVLYVAAIALSHLLAGTIGGVLGYKFLSWYKVKRNVSTLVFAASFLIALVGLYTVAVVNTVFFFSGDDLALTEEPYLPLAGQPGYYDSLKKSDELARIFQLSLIPGRIAFFAFWASAVLLVRNYAKTIGRAKFWGITSLPAITYIIVSVNSILQSESFSLIISAILPPVGVVAGGAFLAVIFLISAKTLKQKGQVTIAHFLIISAFSFILGYAAISPTIHVIDRTHIVFPPFGVLAHSFLGFSLYLISTGFYFSAIRISKDTKIRGSLRHVASAADTSKLLDNIGTAQMELELTKKVEKIVKEQEETLKQETGVQQSVTMEEMKGYLEEVLKETKKSSSTS